VSRGWASYAPSLRGYPGSDCLVFAEFLSNSAWTALSASLASGPSALILRYVPTLALSLSRLLALRALACLLPRAMVIVERYLIEVLATIVVALIWRPSRFLTSTVPSATFTALGAGLPVGEEDGAIESPQLSPCGGLKG